MGIPPVDNWTGHRAPDLIPWSRRSELYWLVLLGINAGLAVGLALAAWFKGQVPGGFAVGSAAFAVAVFALSVRRRLAMRGRVRSGGTPDHTCETPKA